MPLQNGTSESPNVDRGWKPFVTRSTGPNLGTAASAKPSPQTRARSRTSTPIAEFRTQLDRNRTGLPGPFRAAADPRPRLANLESVHDRATGAPLIRPGRRSRPEPALRFAALHGVHAERKRARRHRHAPVAASEKARRPGLPPPTSTSHPIRRQRRRQPLQSGSSRR